MREIKFRGYDGMTWIYGSAVQYDNDTDTWYMIEFNGPDDDWVMVGEVGQFTGLYDRNGREIFEGDIVEVSDHPFPLANGVYEVGYNEVMELSAGGYLLFRVRKYCKVIGNNHDNSELLERR
ncbi:YopX family protein [Sediminibacillus massiliensis]|uniref:YopX family protein n=1 Tax=Sediminibacillus massiliensis TaxID=1926277 RepID=UPI00098845BD|nr:YopX family protein [Sediminibacillus massiliensis]